MEASDKNSVTNQKYFQLITEFLDESMFSY